MQVASADVKTQLNQLLNHVARGEKVVITRRGKPVAMLVPPQSPVGGEVLQVVDEMLATRDKSGPRLGPGLSARKLISQGRRR